MLSRRALACLAQSALQGWMYDPRGQQLYTGESGQDSSVHTGVNVRNRFVCGAGYSEQRG